MSNINGAVVIKLIPFEEWLRKYATQEQRESARESMSEGLVPSDAVIKQGVLMMAV